jgi:uroporphyrin-III C-methyltransferase
MTMGVVHLVGAGPGDPELLTLKAARLLAEAEVVVYDRLVAPAVLDLAAPAAERIFAGKRRADHFMRQVEINELLVRRARLGQRVVRLKGGDPLIFGRGGEEIEALLEAGIPFDVVPGITAAAGCAASAVIPLTHRDHAQTLIIVTGHAKEGEPHLNWDALCQPRQTLVFYMGHKALGALAARLVHHGLPAGLPAAMIENGTLPGQRVIRATLGTIAERVDTAALEGPALLVIGEVAAFGAPRSSPASLRTAEPIPPPPPVPAASAGSGRRPAS